MFDEKNEQTSPTAQPTEAAPQEPVDMFSETENDEGDAYDEGGGGAPIKKIIIGSVIGVLVLAAAGFGAYQLLGKKSSRPQDQSNEQTTSGDEVKTESSDTTENNTEEGGEEVGLNEQVPANDTDGDGLLNDEETAAGTDAAVVDSDSDGLTDREEVQVYHTNPLSVDSDGDTFNDAEELRNGFNPNGSGKLITNIPTEPPAEIQNLNQ